MSIYDEVYEYKSELELRLKELSRYSDAYPNYHINTFSQNGQTRFRIYNSDDKTNRYLSKKDVKMVGSLCNKRYAEDVSAKLSKNLTAADKFLSLHSGLEEFQIAESYNDTLRYFNGNISLDYANCVREWEEMKYERNPYFPEMLIHSSIRGELYRSKSEGIIADSLLETGLAYIPEYPVVLRNGVKIYPDFRILLPKIFKIKYWEHFGRMDEPAYASKNCKRILQLNEIGIVAGKNLIITFETKDCPLSKAYVMSVIENQLLK